MPEREPPRPNPAERLEEQPSVTPEQETVLAIQKIGKKKKERVTLGSIFILFLVLTAAVKI